ncbi:MAG: hypothetical protein JWL94_1394 [Microbacteriaceae bacterium]|jgi:Fe-S cluster assembly iron-binding protein IscA|nr:hypothetical protein [Microbacteriaceae bacterium]
MTLTLTETASTVVKAIAEQSVDSAAGGVRISGSEAGTADFDITVVPDAETNDTIVENDGARVFLDPRAAETLAEAVLDAQVSDDGAVQFSVVAQG